MTGAPHSQLLTDPTRLAALASTGMVGTRSVDGLDRLTRLSARLMGSSGAFLSVVDDSRERVKSSFGWPADLAPGDYAWDQSFGQQVFGKDGPLTVGDTSQHEFFRSHEGARSLGARSMAGTVVHANGHPVGVLYVFDTHVRDWTDADLVALSDLCAIAENEVGFQAFAEARSRLRDQFAWLMNLLPVAVYACDPAGNLLYFNGRASTLFEAAPVLGQPEAGAYSRRPLVDAGIVVAATELPAALACTSGEGFESREFGLGEDVSVLVSADCLRLDEEVIGAVVLLHDVTALRAADRMRDELLALVSHELRTPLTIINGMARVLSAQWDTLPEQDLEAALGDLSSSGTRVERAVENMLVLSRLQHELNEPEPIHLRQAFEETLREHRRLFPGSEVVMTAATPTPVALAVGSWLQLVLVNLLANAELYGDRVQAHTLSAELENDTVVVRVHNSGRVLSASEYEEIFEPFYRAEETAIVAPGVGLGLTVARRLTEAQGGSIVAGPGPEGHGTEVTLVLPAATPTPGVDLAAD